MDKAELSAEEARAWHKDLAVARRRLAAPRDKWHAGYYDLIVAATALERGSQVATINRRHFDPVPGLAVIEPK
jgi:predicted nucleic acid-binding protein